MLNAERSRWALTGQCLWLQGKLQPGALLIEDGKIAALCTKAELPHELPRFDAGSWAVTPGLVDTHVHVNEPGRTEWDGYASATKAAAAGGVTTLIDMPLNSIPATTTATALAIKREAAQGKLWIDVGAWGGVIPGNVGDLTGLIDAGVMGFKCFLIDSGVPEFPPSDVNVLRQALPILRAAGVPLLAHAELAGPIDAALAQLSQERYLPQRYQAFLRSRPKAAEDEAVKLLAALCATFNTPIHIVHHSSASQSALGTIAETRAGGWPLTAETCPHYLCLSAEEVPDGATEYKCVPPIREAENREALWRALSDHVLDQVVSDHSPCEPALKRPGGARDFFAAWGGIASLQLGLPLMWTELSRRGFSLAQLIAWMCEAPARLGGLARRKGRLTPGFDADIVIWDPDREYVIRGAELLHRHPVTPYEGRTVCGVVHHTFVRGRHVYDQGRFSPVPEGTWLTR